MGSEIPKALGKRFRVSRSLQMSLVYINVIVVA